MSRRRRSLTGLAKRQKSEKGNGKKATSYTFKMNYYWMLGDNRYDSMDSRIWGFVPEDHIIGKAVAVWMSWDSDAPLLQRMRWDRLLKPVK